MIRFSAKAPTASALSLMHLIDGAGHRQAAMNLRALTKSYEFLVGELKEKRGRACRKALNHRSLNDKINRNAMSR